MSGDLISRSVLMEDIRNNITECSGIMDWLKLINSQHTAYDVDKVVEQLYELGGVDGFDECEKAYDNAIEDAIKVVKAGGINE